jgi:hypothetical protein
MNATDKITAVKKINGYNQEIIQIFDKETGKRLFTTLTSTSDIDIIVNVKFEINTNEINFTNEEKEEIANLIISMK